MCELYFSVIAHPFKIVYCYIKLKNFQDTILDPYHAYFQETNQLRFDYKSRFIYFKFVNYVKQCVLKSFALKTYLPA